LANSRVQVFVHLAYGFGAASWNHRWKQGKILGINEPFPYGYYRAETMGCSVTYSQDQEESGLSTWTDLNRRGPNGGCVHPVPGWGNCYLLLVEANLLVFPAVVNGTACT